MWAKRNALIVKQEQRQQQQQHQQQQQANNRQPTTEAAFKALYKHICTYQKKSATAAATLEIFENSPKKGCQKRVTTTRSPT